MKRLPEHTAVRTGSDLYLNTSLLQPCDVLLTRAETKVGGWIARLTAGPFSHAAVVVNPWVVFESDDVGVGYTALRIDRIEGHSGAKQLLSALPGVDRATLLRHRELTHDAALDMEEALVEALYPAFGRQYPEWARLAAALPGGPFLKRLGRLLLSARDALEGERVWNPGPFCSQLVASALTEVFQKANMSLFVPPRVPAEVNPNALLESQLRPVPDAIRHADPNAYLDVELVEQLHGQLPTPSRQESTASLVKTRVLATMNVEAANALLADQKRVFRALSHLIRPPSS